MKKFRQLFVFLVAGAFITLSMVNVKIGSTSCDKVSPSLSILEAKTTGESGGSIPSGGCSQVKVTSTLQKDGTWISKTITWSCKTDTYLNYCQNGTTEYTCSYNCNVSDESQVGWGKNKETLNGATCYTH
jgi:hypothetical protein